MSLRPSLPFILLAFGAPTRADTVFENARCRLVIGGDARCVSLVEKATGRGLCAPDAGLHIASANVGGKECMASSAAVEGGRLALRFAGATAAALRGLLSGAQVRQRPATLTRIDAEDSARLEGAMVKGSALGVREPEASGDAGRLRISRHGAEAGPAMPERWRGAPR